MDTQMEILKGALRQVCALANNDANDIDIALRAVEREIFNEHFKGKYLIPSSDDPDGETVIVVHDNEAGDCQTRLYRVTGIYDGSVNILTEKGDETLDLSLAVTLEILNLIKATRDWKEVEK
jgi:hypothetical protein